LQRDLTRRPEASLADVTIAITTRMKKMSKKDAIDAVAEHAEITKEKAGVALDALIAYIEKTLKKGDEVPFRHSANSRSRSARRAWAVILRPAPKSRFRPPTCRSSNRQRR